MGVYYCCINILLGHRHDSLWSLIKGINELVDELGRKYIEVSYLQKPGGAIGAVQYAAIGHVKLYMFLILYL